MQPRRGAGGGRAIMFVAARRKEGVTTAARAVAQAAGPGAVYAIDLDLKRNALAQRARQRRRRSGPKIDGRLNGVSLLQRARPERHRSARARAGFLLPPRRPHADLRRRVRSRACCRTGARVGDLGSAATIGMRRAPAARWWSSTRLRLSAARSALRVAPHMDGVVLVVGAGRGRRARGDRGEGGACQRRRQSDGPRLRRRDRAGDGDRAPAASGRLTHQRFAVEALLPEPEHFARAARRAIQQRQRARRRAGERRARSPRRRPQPAPRRRTCGARAPRSCASPRPSRTGLGRRRRRASGHARDACALRRGARSRHASAAQAKRAPASAHDGEQRIVFAAASDRRADRTADASSNIARGCSELPMP